MATRQRNGGQLGLRRVSVNGRIGGTRMSSRHRKSRLCLSLSCGVVGGDVKCTERAPYKMSRIAASLSRW